MLDADASFQVGKEQGGPEKKATRPLRAERARQDGLDEVSALVPRYLSLSGKVFRIERCGIVTSVNRSPSIAYPSFS